jgi:tripartite-type tricarboxylate transporter receptor subunit TctC
MEHETSLRFVFKKGGVDMSKIFPSLGNLVIGIAFVVGASTPAFGQDTYKGKTIRFVVGYSAGGGYDAYTRIVARHIGKHIPGNPVTVVENMTGAGSLIAANYMYNKAEPDGLTVGVWNAHNLFSHAMGDKRVKLEGRKLGWIGSPGKDSIVCGIMGFTALKTLREILDLKRPVKFGATRGGNTLFVPRILNKWVGTRIETVPGYKGTSKIRLAMQSRELDGACWVWESMRTTARTMLEAKGDDQLIPFVIDGEQEESEVKAIPKFHEVIKGKDNLASYDVWNSANKFARPFSVPPGTPKERLGILRKAFQAALADPELLADAKKVRLKIEPVSGEKIEKFVDQIYSMPAQVKENLRFLTEKPKKKP